MIRRLLLPDFFRGAALVLALGLVGGLATGMIERAAHQRAQVMAVRITNTVQLQQRWHRQQLPGQPQHGGFARCQPAGLALAQLAAIQFDKFRRAGGAATEQFRRKADLAVGQAGAGAGQRIIQFRQTVTVIAGHQNQRQRITQRRFNLAEQQIADQ